MSSRFLAGAAVAALFLGAAVDASAQNTLRWASQGDALTFDPHSQNEGPTNTANQQVYEPLIWRNADLEMQPGLALSWEAVEPTVWEFKLREGVTFHDGTPFTADDVVFSFERAQSETSDFGDYITSVESVEVLDDLTVAIRTTAPNPILPNQLTELMMVSRAWAEANDVTAPQDFAGGEENYAVRNANGTGAFELTVREPDVRTVMVKNPDWWGLEENPHNIDEVVYTPIANAATRVAALLSGEIDFLLDPPVQDLERIKSTPGLKTEEIPQIRTIFFGLDIGPDDLRFSDGNPFKEPKVREAMAMAINIEAIKDRVMRDLAEPAGIITSPGVHGYTEALNERPPFDVEGAKALMAEAGYADGFETTMHCPNDRYVNDEAICQAVVGMLAQIGIEVNLVAQSKSIHFAELQNGDYDFYLLGWGVPTLDSHYVFNFLYTTEGSWNFTGFSDERLDELTVAMEGTVDLAERDALIAEAWEIAKEANVYLPLHHQVITWAMVEGVDMPIEAQDSPHFAWARMSE